MSFAEFSKNKLGSAMFETVEGEEKSDLFHASLQSFLKLSAWTKDLRNKSGQSFALQPGYVEDKRPNALADIWQRQHMIGMHVSLFTSINEFAFFCFTQEEFFTDIGHPALEISPTPRDARVPGLWLLDFTAKGGRVSDEHSQQLAPRDQDRYFGAICLGQLMARFVWLHELSHCFNGHVAYAKHHGLAPRLYELADPLNIATRASRNLDADGQRALRCVEFDADQSAFWGNFNVQFQNLENLPEIKKLDSGQRVRLVLFAGYATVWLIEQFQIYLDAGDTETHPEPRLRLQNLLRTTASNILPLDEGLAQLHTDVIRQFEVMRAAIPQMYGSADLAARIRDETLMAELMSCDAQLDDLKAALRDHEFSNGY